MCMSIMNWTEETNLAGLSPADNPICVFCNQILVCCIKKFTRNCCKQWECVTSLQRYYTKKPQASKHTLEWSARPAKPDFLKICTTRTGTPLDWPVVPTSLSSWSTFIRLPLPNLCNQVGTQTFRKMSAQKRTVNESSKSYQFGLTSYISTKLTNHSHNLEGLAKMFFVHKLRQYLKSYMEDIFPNMLNRNCITIHTRKIHNTSFTIAKRYYYNLEELRYIYKLPKNHIHILKYFLNRDKNPNIVILEFCFLTILKKIQWYHHPLHSRGMVLQSKRIIHQ